jgi:hypothetical protein
MERNHRSRDSSVSIITGWMACVRFPAAERLFSYAQRPDRLWGPPSLLSNGHWGFLSPGVKWPGREADHSSPSSAEAKNGGAIPPLPHTSSWHSA